MWRLFMDLASVVFVGGDDSLHERMADDIAFSKLNNGDALNAVQNANSFDEAGAFVTGQIDLRGVAGDDSLRAMAKAGEEHEHLFGGAILRFVQDDKGLIQGAAAHVSKRGDFQNSLFVELEDFLR